MNVAPCPAGAEWLEVYPAAFDLAAVVELRWHGYPWTPLLRVARDHLLAPRPTDAFFVKVQNEPVDRLKRRLEGLVRHVCVGEIAEVGEPVVFGTLKLAGEWAADFVKL